jgi:nucleoid-associated protein YgaU
MTIYQGSRYEYSTVDFVATSQDADNNAVVFYDSYFEESMGYFEYTVIEGDRLDQIADKFYHAPDRWWYILDNNPQISDPFNIPIGTVLRVPRD